MKKGFIIKQISNQYQILSEHNEYIHCVAMGKLRLKTSPKVGDYIIYEKYDDLFGIESILPRKNDLIRPNIANVDQVIILMSALSPNFSNKLLDRLIAMIEYHNIQPVIVFTKMDLIQNELDDEVAKYQKIGYQVIKTGIGYNDEAFKNLFKDKVSVLTGNSGVGKSSLLNRLNPAFNLKTQQTSKALGRGKHTTRHTQLFEIHGGWVADTPGFSSLDFSNFDVQQLAKCFIEFNQYTCKYQNCVHIHEPDCGVKAHLNEIAQSRYENYLELVQLVKGERK